MATRTNIEYGLFGLFIFSVFEQKGSLHFIRLLWKELNTILSIDDGDDDRGDDDGGGDFNDDGDDYGDKIAVKHNLPIIPFRQSSLPYEKVRPTPPYIDTFGHQRSR